MSNLTRFTSNLSEFITQRVESELDKLESHPDYIRARQEIEGVEFEIKNLAGDKNVSDLINKIGDAACNLEFARQERAYIQGFKDAIILMKEF